MRTSSSELLVELDRARPRRLRAQIEGQLRDAIRAGRLPRGTLLPSTRSLANDLAVTRGVVVAAYEQLVSEGYLVAEPGSGTMVGGGSAAVVARVPRGRRDPPAVVDFGAGVPDLSLFPRLAWARASRTALATLPDDHLGYDDGRGLEELGTALIDYLARVRGVRAIEDHLFVGSGFSHGIAVLAEAFARAGHESIAVEDPHRGAGPQLAHSRLEVHGVELDAQGVVMESLRRTGARLVLVTPAHQAPTGIVLSPDRRAELVQWARAVDGYIIEDDFDAEFRYDHHPVGALQGLAPDRVVYCGTTSKTLAPGIRLGWVITPAELVESVLAVRRGTDVHTSTLLQATFAAFVRSGDLDRHLRKARRVYRQRRDALTRAVTEHFPEATPTGISAGLQAVLQLPGHCDESAVVDRANSMGVRVVGLSAFRTGPTHLPPALVLGYGRLQPAEIERGIKLLAVAARHEHD